MMDESQPLLSSSNGHVANPQRRTVLACGAILLTETLERIAFYGIVGNLVLFLNMNPLEWKAYNASSALFIFTGFSYITSIIGGWIADSFLGKFKTLFIFFLVYLVGYGFMPALGKLTEDTDGQRLWCQLGNNSGNGNVTDADKTHVRDEGCAMVVFLALGIMAFGNGVVKANIAPFGADQVKHEGPITTRNFFTWFYWCINVGALISLGLLSFVQQQLSFFYGYLVPCACLLLALVVFAAGHPFYISKPPGGSVLTNIMRVMCEACRKSACVCGGATCCCCAQGPTDNLMDSPSSASYSSQQELTTSPGCLDRAKVRYGGSFHDSMVNDVKAICKILAVFLAMVPYWLVYFQMETTFVVQGVHMKLDFDVNKTAGAEEFKIPMAWLSLFDVVFLIILLPLFDRVIYPALDRRGYSMSLRCRIVVGMVFSMAAVIVAGGVEMRRLYVYNVENSTHDQVIGDTTYHAANMSILWQIPQYALIGVGEVFASVAGLELAYIEAPRSMQGLIMGLFMLCQGLGSILGMASIYPFLNTWFSSFNTGSINCRDHCHLDYFYFFLAGVQLVGIFLFMLVTWRLGVGYRVTQRHNKGGGFMTVANSGTRSDTESGGETPRRRRSEAGYTRHVQRQRSSSSSS